MALGVGVGVDEHIRGGVGVAVRVGDGLGVGLGDGLGVGLAPGPTARAPAQESWV